MLHKRLKAEGGFTLIELLVVILIIGILAAIALPTFLNQRQKGQDAEAKSNVRNAVSLVESCAADKGGDYTGCNTATAIPASSGLSAGAGQGQVQVVGNPNATGYVVSGLSKSTRTFTYTKNTGATPPITRTATGGGQPNGTW